MKAAPGEAGSRPKPRNPKDPRASVNCKNEPPISSRNASWKQAIIRAYGYL
ncbi:hypothetical protein K0M31_005157 [Melipona bicolor]|uniref:Uncharacterized protein n=1 Tax=Melipona bicolor TaxID=60889 RepID=A0AA40KM63_9HYME|nr:hypothetical protein K0M31_005157 [Melipona bicolor]